jgi:hypothetical protein
VTTVVNEHCCVVSAPFPTNDLFTHKTYILKYMTKSYQVLEEVIMCGLRASSVIKDLSKLGRGRGETGGNADKVILGAKTPHPWCTTTVKGVIKKSCFSYLTFHNWER